MPSPPCAIERVSPTCENMSNTRYRAASGIPTPLSETDATASSPSIDASTVTSPSAGVYFAAFPIKLARTCVIRALSISTTIGSVPAFTVSVWRCASIAGIAVSTARATTVCNDCIWRRSSTFPPEMRATSNRSSTSRTIVSTCLSIISRARPTTSASAAPMRSTCSPFRNGANGFRSSCAKVARNSSL